MNPWTIVAALLVGTVLLGWARLGLWWARAPESARGPLWRFLLLLTLQPVTAGLLWLTIAPPPAGDGAVRLVVATTQAPAILSVGAGERVVALPEAGRIAGAAPAPDLATALRRNPGVRSLRIVGGGLEPRDLPAARSLPVSFDPPAPVAGIVDLTQTQPVAPGAAFRVSVGIEGLNGGSARLLDPAGREVDTAPIGEDGRVTLSGTTRDPSLALFTLTIRDAAKRETERATIPVTVLATPARLAIRAAAPGPEVKQLRRWASDAGLAPAVDLPLGKGLVLADGRIDLGRTDALVIDDRSWAAMGAGERAGIAAAVRGGMGLVVRLTGPVPRGWQMLGLTISGGAAITPTVLPAAAPSDAALTARRGPGTADAPASAMGERDTLPALTRQAVAFPNATPILRDAKGAVLAGWRPFGRGRVAALSLLDTAGLVTSGHGDRFEEIWSALVSAVARPAARTLVATDPLPRAGLRMTLCPAVPSVTAPDGRTTRPVADPAADGCAGYWPQQAGLHRLASGQTVFVQPADALPAEHAARRREATLLLAGAETPGVLPAITRGPSRLWFLLGWLACVTALWLLERRRPRAAA